MKVNGRDVALYASFDEDPATLLGLSKSCDLQVDCDMKEFTSMLSGNAKRQRPGRYGWQANCELIVDDADATLTAFLTSIKGRKRLTISMNIEAPGGKVKRLYGSVYVSSWKLSGAIGSMAVYSVVLAGDDELLVE